MSNPGELFNLIKYLETEKVDEFEYSEQDFSVSLKRTLKSDMSDNSAAANAALVNMLLASRQAASSFSSGGSEEPSGEPEKGCGKAPAPAAEDESKFKFIESPITGTFYRAPSPTSAPYAENGQRVNKGQVVCIVEAMKLMNEIKSEHDGVIERICVENGTLVQAKQRLFYLLHE
ncbi:MAG: acetyl-CoA carboxylase, biotin carboxyl carrier protein [Candidatus Wallbacteria bacterium GWC2_49_35]|uniref:Biotin carboxyl carrier protein of acetyl-CoA carboxylase n=1 Tax=Candidatus Wallbacteria bacterium GWC2_49_35 TaxID=1817813 RepID=A0A1F7WRK8_9BACT|nr:MAG: acetyl-CoA carboxylase, biotin carboxyl carrier protein [Candidatus Wallbacteria bacterium GWC2_49_35]